MGQSPQRLPERVEIVSFEKTRAEVIAYHFSGRNRFAPALDSADGQSDTRAATPALKLGLSGFDLKRHQNAYSANFHARLALAAGFLSAARREIRSSREITEFWLKKRLSRNVERQGARTYKVAVDKSTSNMFYRAVTIRLRPQRINGPTTFPPCMKPHGNNFAIEVIGLLLSGCAQDVANRYYSSQRYGSRPAKEVELLFRAPSRTFTVIADLQSRNESPSGMKRRAAKIGADAIIVSPIGGLYRLNEEWAGTDSMSHSYSRLIGSAIKYNK